MTPPESCLPPLPRQTARPGRLLHGLDQVTVPAPQLPEDQLALLRWAVEFTEDQGRAPYLGGHMRLPVARRLESAGLVRVVGRGPRAVEVTAEGLAFADLALAPAARPCRFPLDDPLRLLDQLDRKGVRELRALAEVFNIRGRATAGKPELLRAFDDVRRLLDAGWRFDPSRAFKQWRAGGDRLTLREAARALADRDTRPSAAA